MAARPTGAVDYASAQSALVTTPLDAQIKSGFVVSQPSVHLLNGVFRRLFRWIEYLNGITIPDETGGITITYNGRAIQLPFPLVGANDAAKLASAQIFKREEKTLSEGGTGASIWAGSGAVTAGTPAVRTLSEVFIVGTQAIVSAGLKATTNDGDIEQIDLNTVTGASFSLRSDGNYQYLEEAYYYGRRDYTFNFLIRHESTQGGRAYTDRGGVFIIIAPSGNLIRARFTVGTQGSGIDWGRVAAGLALVLRQGTEYIAWDLPDSGDASASRYDFNGSHAPKAKSSGFNISSGQFSISIVKSATENVSGGAGSRLTTSGALSLSNSPPFSLTNYQYTGGKIVLTFAAAVTATSFDSVALARGATTLLTLAASDASFSTSAPFTASWTAADVASDGGTITFTFSKGGAGLAVAEWNAVASTAANFGIFVDSAGDHYLRIKTPSGISNNDKLFIRRAPAA